LLRNSRNVEKFALQIVKAEICKRECVSLEKQCAVEMTIQARECDQEEGQDGRTQMTSRIR
jgi:hypothetical protein